MAFSIEVWWRYTKTRAEPVPAPGKLGEHPKKDQFVFYPPA
jgi:hypothetical protein